MKLKKLINSSLKLSTTSLGSLPESMFKDLDIKLIHWEGIDTIFNENKLDKLNVTRNYCNDIPDPFSDDANIKLLWPR